MAGHHKMLLMSATVPISGLFWRHRRREGRCGTAGTLDDRSVATKPWHMACVAGTSMIGEGEGRLGRGDRATVSRYLHSCAGIILTATCSVCVGEMATTGVDIRRLR